MSLKYILKGFEKSLPSTNPRGVRIFINVNPQNLNGKVEFAKQSKSLGRYAHKFKEHCVYSIAYPPAICRVGIGRKRHI